MTADREARYRAAENVLWSSIGVAPTERWVRLPRIGTEVRVQELGDGPPVVFVHGASTCGTSWADLAARLPDMHCLLLDRPGTGLSDPLDPPIRGIADLVALADALVVDVIDGLGIESADLVTTSFGGFFGFRAALAAPDRIRQIVEFGWSAGARLGNAPLAFLSPARRGDPRLVLAAADRGRISAPVRFIWGEGDPFGGPEIAREFAAGFPDATLELLPGVGHAPWMDDAEHAARLVREFLIA